MHNFTYNTATMPSFKEIQSVYLEEFCAQILVYIFLKIRITQKLVIRKSQKLVTNKIQCVYVFSKFQWNPFINFGENGWDKNFPKLRITKEVLISSSEKFHMHNFTYTTTTLLSFKKIHSVSLEEVLRTNLYLGINICIQGLKFVY